MGTGTTIWAHPLVARAGTGLAARCCMLFDAEFLGPQLGSIAMACLFVFAAVKQPRLGRIAYMVLFAGASFMNAWTALRTPELYLIYADVTVVGWYRDFILGLFAAHTQAVVLMIAAGQASVALGLAIGGRSARAACWGATVFLLALLPLGAGSGFPSPLIFAIGSAWLAVRDGALRGSLLEHAANAFHGARRSNAKS